MSFNQTPFSGAANLLGNVEIPRNILPMVRSSTRRLNPDGISSAPYYAGATGKTLRINFTKEVATVVTADTVDVLLTGTSLATIITNINAATSSANVNALDLDGFLAIRNLNPGKTHTISIAAFTTPADDAAPVLGFQVFPLPGSTSFAGEIAAAPGSRVQSNPQTTTLIAKDDSLGGGELNRSLSSILQMVENLRAELARDVVVNKDITLTFTAHATDGIISARVNDDSIRLFYPEENSVSIPTLTQFYRVLDQGQEEIKSVPGNTSGIITYTSHTATNVQQLYYATAGTPFNNSVFSVWGVPDGGSIASTTTVNKSKHSSTSITSIKGNIVNCASATFVTLKVKAGDPVRFSATNLQPFDHSGWFTVDAVIDETHLAIRPMALTEQTPVPGEFKPRWLNPAAGGTLRVAVGRFIPAGDVFVAINGSTGSHTIRASVGVPFIETLVDDRARGFAGTLGKLTTIVSTHLNSFTAHDGNSLVFGPSVQPWADGTGLSATKITPAIEEILSDLGSSAVGIDGAGKIGANQIVIGGAAPNTINGPTVRLLITNLLGALQAHVILASGAHAASAITYAGGGNWADGTTNPATTVESQLDKIVSDLSGAGGAVKVGFGGSGAWADGTTNPATTIEGQLDKIVSDLAPSTGSAKIGGAASGTDIATGTVAAQIADLAVNWLKMARANVIAAAQTFTSLITANGGLTAGVNQNITISGTGRYLHPTRTLIIQGASAQPESSASVLNYQTGGGVEESAGNVNLIVPISGLHIGAHITAVRARLLDSVGTVVHLRVVPDGAGSTAGSADSAGNGTTQTISVTGLNLTFSSLSFSGPGIILSRTSGSGIFFLYRIEIDYDQPNNVVP